MAIVANQVSVGAVAVLLSTADDQGRQTITLMVPSGGSTVFIGNSAVTTTTGFPVAAGERFTLTLDVDDRLYGIVVGPGAQTVNVITQGV